MKLFSFPNSCDVLEKEDWEYLYMNKKSDYFRFPFPRVHSYAMFIPESMANCKDPQ